MKKELNTEKILTLIKNKKISPGKGLAIIKMLKEQAAGHEQYTALSQPGEVMRGNGSYQAVVLSKPGSIEDIELRTVYPREPRPEEVQVLVKDFSLNFGDLLCVSGMYPTMPDYPFTPGFEFSGIVLKTGNMVSRVHPGDQVIGMMGKEMGGQSGIVTTHEKMVVVKPANCSFEEGCAYPVVFLTGYYVFQQAAVKQGEKVLIQTAAGGTGLILVQLALSGGAEVFATAGSEHKLQYLRQLGVQHTINYLEEDFAERVMEITGGGGVDVVVNTLAGNAIQKGIDILSPFGRYIEIAMTGLKTSEKLNLSRMTNNQVIHSVDLRKLLITNPDTGMQLMDKMAEFLEAGDIKPKVCKIFPIEKVKEAYAYMENRSNIGKIVVSVNPRFSSLQDIQADNSLCGDIAVIGLSGRFADAANAEEYWQNLAVGKLSVREIPPERWNVQQYYDPNPGVKNKSYNKWSGYLNDIDMFDARFFGISGKEAELTDPQQRLFLEESYKALDDAGYAIPDISGKKCGVFVGVSSGDYLTRIKRAGREHEPQTFWGNETSILSARISYFLNLTGPSLAVDTACSSSLVAIQLACQSILAGESELAIAGGVFIVTTEGFHIICSQGRMLSPTGLCKTFDNTADGFVPGEAAGAVILKSLDQATHDGDHIYGIIKAGTINQDGKTNGITAPSTLSQTSVERETYRKAGISADKISYIETHGTATKLGDPVEIDALINCFKTYTQRKEFCALGSVKTNIGHAVTAAGIASIIKVLLALKYKQIPPSINFQTPNEHIDFKNSPFYVNTELKSWDSHLPRYAGISSFGFSGTNVHLLITGAPQPQPDRQQQEASFLPFYFVPLSAKTKTALKQKINDLARWVKANKKTYTLDQLVYSLLMRKTHFNCRLAITTDSMKSLENILEKLVAGREPSDTIVNNIQEHTHSPSIRILSKVLIGELDQLNKLPRHECKEKIQVMAELYVNGNQLDWSRLFKRKKYIHIPVPVYPFERTSFWVAGEAPGSYEGIIKHKVHPFLGENISGLAGLKFRTFFSGKEKFIVRESGALPREVYPEMALAALNRMGMTALWEIKNLHWGVDFLSGDIPLDLNIHPVYEEVLLEAVSEQHDKVLIHFQCKASRNILAEQNIDLAPWKSIPAGEIPGGLIRSDGEQVLLEIKPGNLSAGFFLDPALIRLVAYALDHGVPGLTRQKNTVWQTASLESLQIKAAGSCYILMKLKKEIESGIYIDAEFLDAGGTQLAHVDNWQFQARAGKAVSSPADIEEDESGLTYYLMEKQWTEAPAIQKQNEFITGEYIILTTKINVAAFTSIFKRIKGLRPVCISFSAGELNSPEQGEALAVKILREYDSLKGLIDCIDYQSGESEPEQTGRFFFVRKIIKAVVEKKEPGGFTLLHLTDGLIGFKAKANSLSGAFMAGLYKMLGAEYGKLSAGTMDLDLALSGEADFAALMQQVLGEISIESESCYRDGKKYIPGLKPVYHAPRAKKIIQKPLKVNQEKVVVISGGTRGIGMEIAGRLVKEGVKKLVLMGIQPLPPAGQWSAPAENCDPEIVAKVEKLRKLQEQGITLRLYIDTLTDSAKLEDFFRSVREELGEIGGVIHCAGTFSHENHAFIHKTPAEVTRVLEPKIRGLVNLGHVFENDQLDFFILFSSISALMPSVAVGGSDYATANAFMDYYAQYQFARGKTYYRSVSWSSWRETGMGAVNNPVYRQLGLVSHLTRDGFFLLERILELSPVPFVSAFIAKDKQFDPAVLLYLKQDEQKRRELATEDLQILNVTLDFNRVDEETVRWFKQILSDELRISVAQLDNDSHFDSFGLDSILLVDLINRVEEKIGIKIDPELFLEYPTITKLSTYIHTVYISGRSEHKSPADIQNKTISQDNGSLTQFPTPVPPLTPFKPVAGSITVSTANRNPPIAVIGIDCQFPGSKNQTEFWKNLQQGFDGIQEIPALRWDKTRYYKPEHQTGMSICKWGGFLDDVDYFDPAYFKLKTKLAPQIDPLIRKFLEVGVQAIRHAGYEDGELAERTVGVFVGSRVGNYSRRIITPISDTVVGAGQNFIGAHLAHFLNLQGPNIVVDTACSSSLLSTHLAMNSLARGESYMAIAGGVDILLDEIVYLTLSEARALSPDGKCHTFDVKANGFVPGEGAGAVVLKLLDNAVRDGDRIYAVIEASAVNNDGHTMGITTPNPKAQKAVIVEALKQGNINPATVTAIEAHGTGTLIGDPIELKALTAAFSQYTDQKQYCGVGSVKTNTGHMLSAAGIGSIIKMVLSVYHKKQVPTLHCLTPNPRFNFAASPFFPNTQLRDWKGIDGVLRGGINSFGFGGTNVHMILSNFQPAGRYVEKRKPLEPVSFNKQRFWLDKDQSSGGQAPPVKSSMLNFIKLS